MHGCSTYSSPPAARSSTGIDGDRGVEVPQAVDVDPDPAVGAERVAHGLEPGLVVGERLAGLGDLDLGGAAAAAQHDGVRLLGTDGRHGDVDRHARSRSGAGQSPAAASSAQRSHGSATSASYSRKGLHSPQPAAPRISTPSRTVMPRNRVRIGRL